MFSSTADRMTDRPRKTRRSGSRNHFLGGLAFSAVTAALLSWAAPASAGCGCEKAPPDLASVRPAATYAGAKVTIFGGQLNAGQSYTVDFVSGVTAASASVNATAVILRDLADGTNQVQLVVTLPTLPLGPTRIDVRNAGGLVMSLADDELTVVPVPIAISSTVGAYTYPGYRAAVGRDGTVYVTLDMSGVTQPRVIRAQALGYAMRFTASDVVFYNTQGFLMQLLDERMPGLFSISPTNSAADSDVLQYSRHEFNTFFLQHGERQAHALDPNDSNWHLDGSRHIDHEHLVLAIAAVLNNGYPPAPGATPPFNLTLDAQTLFQEGIVGKSYVTLSGFAKTKSYNSNGAGATNIGDVRSNNGVTLSGYARVEGAATGQSVIKTGFSVVTGPTVQNASALQFMPVAIPDHLSNLGVLNISSHTTLGPGSYRLTGLNVSSYGTLDIDNTAGPVTLYIDGPLSVTGFGKITTADSDPEKFAVYVANAALVQLASYSNVNGLIYAPSSLVQVANFGQLSGAVVGNGVDISGYGQIHYDTALRGQ